MANTRLSPPWYTFANEIKYTYGLSPYITVYDLEVEGDKYTLPIKVTNNNDIATALRNVLPLTHKIGNITIDIVVLNSRGQVVPVTNKSYTPQTLAQTFCTALYKNPLFIGTVLTAKKIPPLMESTIGDVVIVIRRSVVQFFNDDISDLCSNYNEVASKVFGLVTNLNYRPRLRISFSSYDPDCQLQKNIYCKNYCDSY
ncbi:hypothetical protein [Dendrosporobacter sp. 1207_IL3150]|uniref:hypothetical protein n=1 Tax=Dendrosporobacter sp. 1207_IL3150 TaxID=3084054 RepID=UPI002FD8C97E